MIYIAIQMMLTIIIGEWEATNLGGVHGRCWKGLGGVREGEKREQWWNYILLKCIKIKKENITQTTNNSNFKQKILQ